VESAHGPTSYQPRSFRVLASYRHGVAHGWCGGGEQVRRSFMEWWLTDPSRPWRGNAKDRGGSLHVYRLLGSSGSARMGRKAAGSGKVAVDRADYTTPVPRCSYAKSRLSEGVAFCFAHKGPG